MLPAVLLQQLGTASHLRQGKPSILMLGVSYPRDQELQSMSSAVVRPNSLNLKVISSIGIGKHCLWPTAHWTMVGAKQRNVEDWVEFAEVLGKL